MSLSPGTRLGPYEVLAAIGAGGMGEVYRATDSHLKRLVAIKVLPASVAGDADRLARFQREAEVLAALSHPNIATIYGLEKTADFTALVMELVEGEDLSAVIARGPIALPDALPIAKQIADALEAAHEQGIIHRDVKPANIKVRSDGTVKVLDFGLAKAMDPAASSSGEAMNSPTLTARATQMGVILGTAAYMAPEQAKGKAVDRRADIWAFGVVLHEMLTGRHLFLSDTIPETLAHVMTRQVDLGTLPASTPLRLRDLLARCLEKDPKKRLRDIGEARIRLEEAISGAAEEPTRPAGAIAAAPAGSRTRERLAWAALVVAVAVLAPLAMKRFAGSATEPPVSRFELAVPGLAGAAVQAIRPEVSPDGRAIALVVPGDDGIGRIAIRALDAVQFRVLPGTEDASYPFWSPDSRSIAFFSHDTLKKVPASGGPPQTLCPARRGRGGTWSRAGVVVFSVGFENGEHLEQVPDGGGTPVVLTPLGLPNLVLQRWPHFLPDGRHFLFFASARQAVTDGVYVAALGETGATRVLAAFSEARYSDGMLLFVRDSTLVAQPFDATRLVLTPADPLVVSSVSSGGNEGAQAFSVSDSGTLMAVPLSADVKLQLKWFDRRGGVTALGVPANVTSPRISPDGLRVVTATRLRGGQPSGGALSTTDVKSGRSQRLTFVDGGYGSPAWSRDASTVFFGMATAATGISNIVRQPTDGGASQESLVVDRAHKFPQDASPDGSYLVYLSAPTQSTNDLWILSLADRKAWLYATQGGRCRLAPSGRWAVYAGNETGQFEIYVQSFPTPGRKIQITNRGGSAPAWSRDGREIFYQAAGKLMAVPVSMNAGTPATGQATTLFALPNVSDYDVSPDGRFLFAVPVENQTPTAIVTLNWKAGLKK
jgi:Tol biopolymer transport system component